jgi:hypothetical protein
VMSWSGTVTFALASPYEQGGMVSQAFYRPTAVSVAWKVDYRDWRACHFEGSGALGLNDVTFEVISGAPQEIIAPLGRPDEYDFRLTHPWDQPDRHRPGMSSPTPWVGCSRPGEGRS